MIEVGLNRTSTVTDFNRYALELVHLVLTITNANNIFEIWAGISHLGVLVISSYHDRTGAPILTLILIIIIIMSSMMTMIVMLSVMTTGSR